MRAGGVGLICATIYVQPATKDEPGYRTAEEAHAEGLRQIEWPTPDLLLGISTNNGLYESTDQGRSWTLRSKLPDEQVAAFDVTGDSWHLATDQGLYTSPDGGTTWNPLL